jgi:NAD(P)H-flavin reductase
MTPVPYRVAGRIAETTDTVTLSLAPIGDAVIPRPGQFVMLYAPGVGEVPISTSGVPGDDGVLTHTIRGVGAVSRALAGLEVGNVVGVRGPFGTTWPVDSARSGDLVVVAGGIGLAPLRPAIREVLADRDAFGRVSVLVGARTPADLLYGEELAAWRARLDVDVLVTVDAATPAWHGRVGLVTALIPAADLDGKSAVALVCGPEVMMTFVARALLDRGLAAERIWVSTERNMRCGLGHCGHCQLGPLLLCRDGPVVRWSHVAPLMGVREL